MYFTRARARTHTHTHETTAAKQLPLPILIAPACLRIHTCIHTHTHKSIHARTRARTHTPTHANAHAHKHTRALSLTHKVLPRHVCWLALFENAIKTSEYSSIYQHSRSLVNLGTVTLVYLLGFTCAFRSVSDVFQMWNRDYTWTKRDV